ncbi:MAG: glutamate 5-kinase [Patescibacteria group bacterium]
MPLQTYKRVIIKIGTGVLTNNDGQLDRAQLSSSFEDLAGVIAQGIHAVLVTSGAVAMGRSALTVPPRNEHSRQACAAIGQPLLMHAYGELAARHGLTIAQLLITREDFDNRARYLNIRNTLHALLNMNVLPIINENDVVAVDIAGGDAFGGNDAVAAMVGLLIDADLLLILGETDGVLDAPPETGRAQRIPVVEQINEELLGVVGKDSPLGRGGMKRKLEAAKLATHSGIETIIANGRQEGVITNIILHAADTGTRCMPAQEAHSSRGRWLIGGVVQKGSVTVDTEAAKALQKGKSLLPIGILEVQGNFGRGEAIRVLDERGASIAVGLANYASGDLDKIKRLPSSEIEAMLGYSAGDEAIHKDNLALTNSTLTYGK